MSEEIDPTLVAGPGLSCEFRGSPKGDDDSAGDTSAQVTLRAGSGDHFFRVSSYNAGETGVYHFIVVPSGAPPEQAPSNPFRSGENSLPVWWQDWVRPAEASARYRWDALCVAVNWVTTHERVASPDVSPAQREEETALLSDALNGSARVAGQTEHDAEEAWKAWTTAVMSFSHDRMIVPHPVTVPLQRACVKQLRPARPALTIVPSAAD